MSGRSAHARKKITTKAKADLTNRDDGSIFSPSQYGGGGEPHGHAAEFPMPAEPIGTGVGMSSGRFLKFSPPISPSDSAKHGISRISSRPSVQSESSGGSSGRGREWELGEAMDTPEFHALSRRPTIRTEDISGIEKSGLRTMLDKHADGVRKGLAKKLTFRKKKSQDGKQPEVYASKPPDGSFYFGDGDNTLEPYPSNSASQSPMLREYTAQQQQLPMYSQNFYQASNMDMASPGLQPTSSLSAVPQPPPIPQIKRWRGAGNGNPVERWIPPKRDPEFWDPKGDVFVFLGSRDHMPLKPNFRISSKVIVATESRYLISLLQEGLTKDKTLEPTSPTVEKGVPLAQGEHLADDLAVEESEEGILYEIHLRTHAGLSTMDQLRHQISTRNFFSILYGASFIGFSLYQALVDLQHRLDSYMPPESNNVDLLIRYLVRRGMEDVRCDPEIAVSLLAWSESPDVRWDQGWRECFVHCAGMHHDLERCTDYNHLLPVTRALLERAYLGTQIRVQVAENRLANFYFGDMWPVEDVSVNTEVKAAALRLQMMLQAHYSRVFRRWPPIDEYDIPRPGSPMESDGDLDKIPWLNRMLAWVLQRDFGALYDYLVDRSVGWDVSEARAGRKWMMASESNPTFDADRADLPLTDILIEFDNASRFPHIPHPYPLIPESPPLARVATAGTTPGTRARAGSFVNKIQLAYTESANINLLGSEFVRSDLLDAFSRFEKTDKVGEVNPALARLGRWVVIYGVLQTLASVTVDTPGVRYRENVPYHLGVHLEGSRIPPWERGSDHEMTDSAMHELSYCWVTPRTWANAKSEENGIVDEPDHQRTGEEGVGKRGGHVDSVSYRQMRAQIGAAEWQCEEGDGAIRDEKHAAKAEAVIRDFDEEPWLPK